jgi:uracil-DNA glycosylase family 4
MSDAYRRLLDATISHLESLQSQGVEFVTVRPESLAGLSQKAPARPAPAAQARKPVVAPQPSRPVFDEEPETPAPLVQATPASSARPFTPSASVASRWSKAAMPTASPTPTFNPLPPPLPAKEKEAAMAALRKRVLACVKCEHLAASRQTVVFGVGDIHAKIMFIGEAPGADEDHQGEPFVGRAGELLTKIIVAMGLSRETVFIANILKCRPDTPGQTAGNRKPRPEEMATCIPWLEEQINIIQPQVMVALGATAVEGLLGKTAAGITRLRGTWQSYRGIPLMPTYHPAYLLRNQAITEKRKVWEDMMLAMEKAGYPISAKQRGFFLSKP